MPDDERLSSSLQESILTALCFDNEKINTILPILTPELFEGVYHEIAARVLDYRSRFGSAPGKSHIDDLFDDVLADTSHKQYQTYNRLIIGMLEQYSNGFDITYVVSRTAEFARRQQLKRGVLEAADRYSQGGDNVAEDVERIMLDAVNTHMKSLDLGTRLGDVKRSLRFLDKDDSDHILTGIKEFDKNGIYPVKKQLFLFVAPYKKGKSWFLTHIGKMGLLQGWTVAEATLEMSEEEKLERYIQSLYSVSKRDEGFYRADIKKDDLGRMIGLDVEQHKAKMAFEDPKTRERIEKRMENAQWHNKLNRLIIKEFPSAETSLRDIELWLDQLEYAEGIYPDMLMVDQPLAMGLGDPRFRRQTLGSIGFGLKGMATKRNMAVVVPHQTNREGARASRVRTIHTAEDISLIHTCDKAITYSQTSAEHRLGLARLYVDSIRSEKSQFTVLISQSYQSGQFILQSAMMNDRYDGYLAENSSKVQDEDLNIETEDEEDC